MITLSLTKSIRCSKYGQSLFYACFYRLSGKLWSVSVNKYEHLFKSLYNLFSNFTCLAFSSVSSTLSNALGSLIIEYVLEAVSLILFYESEKKNGF